MSDAFWGVLIGGALSIVASVGAQIVVARVQADTTRLNLEHARKSDRTADQRRQRDAQLNLLRTSLEPALAASLALGQVVRDTHAIWSQEAPEARNERHAKMIEEASPALNRARVSLMLQPAARSLMALLDDKILPAFENYRSAKAFYTKHPMDEERAELDSQWQQLRDGIAEFRAEALRIVDSLEQPI